MAAIDGKGGNVTFATGFTANVKSWNLDLTGAVHDTTDFTTDGPRTFIAGLTGWSGSYAANLDDTTPVVAPGGAAAAATFTITTGRTFVGSIIVTGVRPSVNVDGLAEVTVDFQGTGSLTIA